MIELEQFIPQELEGAKIDIQYDLTDVVERLSQVLPPHRIWGLFSSNPNETGGIVTFPYSRVDTTVISARDLIWTINYFKDTLTVEDISNLYLKGSIEAFEAVTWIEIGFQGLHNLAISEASKNWTTDVGHHPTAEERAQRIMTTGKKMYDACLVTFTRYRNENNMKGDYFEEYGLEYLLDPFLELSNEV